MMRFVGVRHAAWVAALVCNLAFAQNAAIPSLSEEPGQSAVRAPDGSYGVETIDPFTGALKIVVTDLHVTSNGGLDLTVVRNYQSLQKTNTTIPGYLPGRTATGIGWDIHFGRVWRASATQGYTLPAANCTGVVGGVSAADARWNPVLELPDGSRQVLVIGDSGKPYQFITRDRWIGRCVGSGDGGLLVISPQGVKYTFNKLGRVADGNFDNSFAFHPTLIEHPNGTTITISYASISNPSTEFLRINTVTHSEGHSLTFTYDDATTRNARLRTIRLNGSPTRTWTYGYDAALTAGGATFHHLSSVSRPDGEGFDYEYYPSSTSAGAYSLEQITTPLNATVGYIYKSQSFPRHTEGAIPRIVVAEKTIGGNVDAGATWTYDYQPASTASDTTDETHVDGPSNCVIYEHQSATTANEQLWRIGLLLEKRLRASCAGANIRREVYTWESETVAAQAYWARPNVIDSDTFNPRLAGVSITQDGATYTTSYEDYDEWSNARRIVENGQDSRTTTRTFVNDTTEWIVQRLKNETVQSAGTIYPAGTVSNYAIVRTFYSNGNLQNETRAGVQHSYEWHTSGASRGEIRTITDPHNRVTTFTNYVRGIPENTARPLGVSSSRAVNNTGTVGSQTDERGRQTIFGYDESNELTSVQTARTDDSDISVARSGVDTRIFTRGTYRETRAFDGFGKLREVRATDLSTNRFSLRKERFDAQGRVDRSYLPVDVGSPGQYDALVYDELGRLKSVTHTDGTSMSYQYLSGNRVEVTNERNFKTTYTYRSFGTPNEKDLVGISAEAGDVPGPGTTITTTIGRNKLGQVTFVTQGGLTRSYRYDSRFYLYQEIDPELGTITYTRDGLNNITERSVGSSGTISFPRDALYRLDAINYPSGSNTPAVDFEYYPDGQLNYVIRGNTRWDYTYDNNNNLATETLIVDGRTYALVNSHDARDALSGVRYPSGLQLSYAPNAFGQPTQASSALGTHASGVSYYPNGQLKEYTLGNGHLTQLGQNNRLLPTTLRSVRTQTGAAVVDVEYDYDSAGNIEILADYREPAASKSMTYDGVNRLRGASGRWGSGSFTYDARNNIATKSFPQQTLTYVYDGTSGRLTGTTGTYAHAFGYDVYGNITSNGRNAEGFGVFGYDAASNLVRVGSPAKINYAYDGNDRMTVEQRVENNRTRYSVYNRAGRRMLEETIGVDATEYLYLGNTLLASRKRAATPPGITPVKNVLNITSQGVVLAVAVGGVSPTGSVTFTHNGSVIGVASIVNGQASVQIQNLAPGNYTIVATYPGDASNPPITATFQVRVQNLSWLPAVLQLLLEDSP